MGSRPQRRAFVIYECRHGWCISPADPPHLMRDESGDRVWAFSRISQALWWLGQRIGKSDAAPPTPGDPA